MLCYFTVQQSESAICIHISPPFRISEIHLFNRMNGGKFQLSRILLEKHKDS